MGVCESVVPLSDSRRLRGSEWEVQSRHGTTSFRPGHLLSLPRTPDTGRTGHRSGKTCISLSSGERDLEGGTERFLYVSYTGHDPRTP